MYIIDAYKIQRPRAVRAKGGALSYPGLKKAGGERGVTIIEAMISSTILTVAVVASLKAFYHYQEANLQAEDRSLRTVLATERIEQWKSVGAQNFVPGVNVPVMVPSVNSAGVITFTRTLVAVPATTALHVDCTINSAVAMSSGYAYALIQGAYGDAGGSALCFYDPVVRAVDDHTPGIVRLSLTIPTGMSGNLKLNLIDYGGKFREQQIVVNNVVRASYTSGQFAAPNGVTLSIPITSTDTSDGWLLVSIEQINNVASVSTVIDDYNDTTGQTKSPASAAMSIVATPPVFTDDDSDVQSIRITGPGSSAAHIRKDYDLSFASSGDTLRAWVLMDQDTGLNIKSRLRMRSGSGPWVSAVAGWAQLTMAVGASDITTATNVTLEFQQISVPNTSDLIYANQLTIDSPMKNPNAVLTWIKFEAFSQYTDTISHAPYTVTSVLTPTDNIAEAALGWQVQVTVSRPNRPKWGNVTIANTLNR